MVYLIDVYPQLQMSDKTIDKMSDKEREFFYLILNYLQTHGEIGSKEAQQIIGKSPATVRRYLAKFVASDLLEADGHKKTR